MRRFSETAADGQFMSETTDGRYCLYAEAAAEVERLRAVVRQWREEKYATDYWAANFGRDSGSAQQYRLLFEAETQRLLYGKVTEAKEETP